MVLVATIAFGPLRFEAQKRHPHLLGRLARNFEQFATDYAQAFW